MHRNTVTIYLGLGANLGDRRANLAQAVALLRACISLTQLSGLYETEPAYVSNQPRFLNMALCGHTTYPPQELLAQLKAIEHAVGREAGPRFGPRAVDIDILVYGELRMESDKLTIPHPRMAERPFVLVPLAEIAPNLVPPGWTDSIGVLAAQVRGHGDIIERIGPLDPG